MNARKLLAVLAAVVALGWLTWSAVVRLEAESRGWDAHAELAVVDRVERLGGTYYETGSDQKGPLWLGSYRLALAMSNRRDVWFAVAGIIVAVAGVTGAAVGGILRRFGASWPAAVGVGGALWLHLCFGAEEYSRVLYSRNLVIALSAVALWLLASVGKRSASGPRDRLLVALAGAAAGLAVQTNPSALPTCATFAGYLAITSSRSTDAFVSRRFVGPLRQGPVLFGGVAAGVALVAPLWYAARGAFGDFFSQWWTYNSHYADATGESPVGIAAKGFTDFDRYYATHPIQGLALVAALGLVLHWLPTLEPRRRLLAGTVVVWLAAEALSVVSAQRFFGHYLVLTVVPLAVLSGMGLERLVELMAAARRVAVPRWAVCAVVVAGTFLASAPTIGQASVSAVRFRGREATYKLHVRKLAPSEQGYRALVQAHTVPTDYVYLWTENPGLYTLVERTSATRYIENRWMRGRIYGGSTDPRYVLPGTWENWQHDITTTEPALVVIDRAIPVPAGTPLERLLCCPSLERIDNPAFEVYKRIAPLAPCFG